MRPRFLLQKERFLLAILRQSLFSKQISNATLLLSNHEICREESVGFYYCFVPRISHKCFVSSFLVTTIFFDSILTGTTIHSNNSYLYFRRPNDEQQHAPEPEAPVDEEAETTSSNSTRTILRDSRLVLLPSSLPLFPLLDPLSFCTLSESSARKF